jgi:hypothetical protein
VSGVPPTFKNKGKQHGPGTVGVIGAERASYTVFYKCYMAQMPLAPPGSQPFLVGGADICGNCNTIVRALRPQDEWLWLLGDDHYWFPDLLPRLLSHNVDVVVPNCLQRNPPWKPVTFSEKGSDGFHRARLLKQEGLTNVYAAGSAGMLIRRHVLEALDDPWFRPDPEAEGLNEDIYFCQRVREAGFEIWCDPQALLGHIAHNVVWPDYRDGQWQVALMFDGREVIPVERHILDAVPEGELVPA